MVAQVEQFKEFAPKVPDALAKLRTVIQNAHGDRAIIQAKLQEWHENGKLDGDDDIDGDDWVSLKKKPQRKVRSGGWEVGEGTKSLRCGLDTDGAAPVAVTGAAVAALLIFYVVSVILLVVTSLGRIRHPHSAASSRWVCGGGGGCLSQQSVCLPGFTAAACVADVGSRQRSP